MKEQKFIKIIDDLKCLAPEEFKKYNKLGKELKDLGGQLIKTDDGVKFLLEMLKSKDDYYAFYSATQLYSINKKESIETMKRISNLKSYLGTHAILTLATLE